MQSKQVHVLHRKWWIFLLAAIWTTGCEEVRESPNSHQETAVVTEKVAAPEKIQDLNELPKVEWDIAWAITRRRPGYPLLTQTRHSVVQEASKSAGAYHHHPQLTFVDGQFFAIWSTHPTGEDGPGQKIIGATSSDGQNWKSLGTVFEPCDTVRQSTSNGRSLIASPFLSVNDRTFMVAIVNDGIGYGIASTPVTGKPLSETKTPEYGKRIRKPLGRLLREVRSNKPLGPVFWMGDHEKPNALNGFAEFKPPTDLPKSTIVAIKKKLKDPIALSPWDFESPEVEIAAEDGSLLAEPTTQRAKNGLLIRYFRDLQGSQKLYVQFSDDNGNSWTKGQPTPIPDAPSKSVFGRLPNGPFFLIGNQVVSKRGTRRDPLTIGLSDDGTRFKKAFAIRWRTPKFQVESQQEEPDGRGRGFQYPSFAIAKDALWVIYSVNKEAIEISRLDIKELVE